MLICSVFLAQKSLGYMWSFQVTVVIQMVSN